MTPDDIMLYSYISAFAQLLPEKLLEVDGN